MASIDKINGVQDQQKLAAKQTELKQAEEKKALFEVDANGENKTDQVQKANTDVSKLAGEIIDIISTQGKREGYMQENEKGITFEKLAAALQANGHKVELINKQEYKADGIIVDGLAIHDTNGDGHLSMYDKGISKELEAFAADLKSVTSGGNTGEKGTPVDAANVKAGDTKAKDAAKLDSNKSEVEVDANKGINITQDKEIFAIKTNLFDAIKIRNQKEIEYSKDKSNDSIKRAFFEATDEVKNYEAELSSKLIKSHKLTD